ncbi:MAG: CHAD domain-containing protein [Chitinophagales bacterium]
MNAGIGSYYTEQQTICLQILLHYTGDKEQIHQLRVAIKKIRAVLKLLGQLDRNFNYKATYKPYRQIFKSAAPIREEQLLQECLTKLNIEDRLRNTETLKKLNGRFEHKIELYAKQIEGKQLQLNDNVAISSKAIAQYCNKIFKKSGKRWKRAKTDKDYHKIRKGLKELIYSLQLLCKDNRKDVLQTKEMKQAEKLQNALGDWHDNIMLKAKLKTVKTLFLSAFSRELNGKIRQQKRAVKQSGKKLFA